MAKTTLVNADIETGSEVVDALEKSGIKLSVALWMVTPEFDDGRIVLSSPALPQTSPIKDYERVARVLQQTMRRYVPPILILKTTDPTVKELRRIFGRTKSVAGMHLGGQFIGKRFIDEAHVYRIA